MCEILPQIQLANSINIKIAQSLIGKNILDFECFNPILEVIKVYLNDECHLLSWCERNNKNYNEELKRLCEIIIVERGFYEIISPVALADIMKFRSNIDWYILWESCVQNYIDTNIENKKS